MSGSEHARVSQAVIEPLVGSSVSGEVRASQAIQEVLFSSLGYVRASQVEQEVLFSTIGYVRASQVVQEALFSSLGFVRASQVIIEPLAGTLGFVRVTQCVIEPLVANYEVPMVATYPTLSGLQFPVIRAPIFSTEIGSAASGREVRAAMYQNPLWEWTLSYDYLPDNFPDVNVAISDLKTLLGFYISMYGSLQAFQFKDPDDNHVVGQALGTTDGETNIFYLSRTYGGTDGSLTEPIGMADLSQTFNVYLNGALKTLGTDYTINTNSPVANYISFNTTPAAGEAVTADFSYFWWVRFKDDTYEFNKIFQNMWEIKKIVLHSVRN